MKKKHSSQHMAKKDGYHKLRPQGGAPNLAKMLQALPGAAPGPAPVSAGKKPKAKPQTIGPGGDAAQPQILPKTTPPWVVGG